MYIDPKLKNNPQVFRVLTTSLKRFPEDMYNFIQGIVQDSKLGGVHGAWDPDHRILYVNAVSDNCANIELAGLEITRWVWTVDHELSHALDQLYGNVSLKPQWLRLSGWRKVSPKNPLTREENRYAEHRPGFPRGVSPWVYNRNAKFVRDYSKKSPQEDFADVVAVCILQLAQQMNDLADKHKFIKKYVL